MKKLLLLIIALGYSCIGLAQTQQQWQEFLTTLQSSQSQNPHYAQQAPVFKALLADLTTLQALPLWKATVFYQKIRNHSLTDMTQQEKATRAQALLQECAQSYTPQAQQFMQELITYKQALDTVNAKCALPCTSIKAAQQLWQQIKTDLIDPMTRSSFITQFHAASWIGQLIACDIMRSCIDTIDTTIKTIKSNNALPLFDRVDLFRAMLDDFNTLFKTWVNKITPVSALGYNGSLDYYLTQMQQCYDDIRNRSCSFQRSPNFSVQAAMIGSNTAFARHYPYTDEDIFMLLHQNSLIAVASVYNALLAQGQLEKLIELPTLLKDAIEYFETNFTKTINQVNRIGMTYTPDTIELFYNMPLSNHSSTFQLCYNRTTQQCTMHMQFLGQARSRWQQIAFLAAISDDLSNLELASDVILDEKAGIVSWSWVIKNDDDLPCIGKYLETMRWLSFENKISIDTISSLYTGSKPFEPLFQQACNNYVYHYGWPTQIELKALLGNKIAQLKIAWQNLPYQTHDRIVMATAAVVYLGILFLTTK